MDAPCIKLNSGYKMPMIGMGTWHHGPQEELSTALRYRLLFISSIRVSLLQNGHVIARFAIKNGYRHIDGAHIYKNESEVGQIYHEILSTGDIKREDLFLASKLWSTHHHPDHVEEAFQASLNKLGLDYMDLYYIHWPSSFQYGTNNLPEDENGRVIQTDDDYVDTWRAMEKLVEKGLVRSLGICNFNSGQIKRILQVCKIKPAVLQIENNPRLQNEILRKFCEKHEIVMIAYSPFGSPDLPWGKKLPHLLVDDTLKSVAQKHGKSTAQVVLRWQIQRGVCVIPKSIFENELMDNLKITDFELDNADMEKIRKLNQNLRKIVPVKELKDGTIVFRDENSKFYPFRGEETEDCLQ